MKSIEFAVDWAVIRCRVAIQTSSFRKLVHGAFQRTCQPQCPMRRHPVSYRDIRETPAKGIHSQR